jgi:hypothetical protein
MLKNILRSNVPLAVLLVLSFFVTSGAIAGKRTKAGTKSCQTIITITDQQLGEKDLDKTLSPEFLKLKNDPRLLSQYIRGIVGYDLKNAESKHIPYLAALVPHFLKIFEDIPLQARLSIQSKVRNPMNYREATEGDFGSIDVELISSTARRNMGTQKVSLDWFNDFVIRVLFYEAVYRDPAEVSSFSTYLSKLSTGVGFIRHPSGSVLPLVTFNTIDPQSFIPYWEYGITPISVLDKDADPYDGIEQDDKAARSRLGFAAHDALHGYSFVLLLAHLKESIARSIPFYSFRKLFWRTEAPAEIYILRKALARFSQRVTQLDDVNMRLFLNNFLWVFLHETTISHQATAETLLAASGFLKPRDFLKLQNSENWNLKYIISNSREVTEQQLTDPSRLRWVLPESWRTTPLNMTLIRSSTDRFCDLLTMP